MPPGAVNPWRTMFAADFSANAQTSIIELPCHGRAIHPQCEHVVVARRIVIDDVDQGAAWGRGAGLHPDIVHLRLVLLQQNWCQFVFPLKSDPTPFFSGYVTAFWDQTRVKPRFPPGEAAIAVF